MQTIHHLLEPVFEPAGDGTGAELQPLGQQGAQVLDLRTAVEADDIEVDAVAALQVGGGEQVQHQRLHIDAVGTRHDHQPGRILMVRLVAQILHHGQLLVLHLVGDLLQHLGAGHLEGQRGDDDVTILALVAGPHAHTAGTGLVGGAQLAA